MGNQNAFPKPLSPAEEEACIRLYAEGTETEREAAREKLILHNLRLCAHIAKKYARTGREQDDLVSIGTIGLIKAVNTFNSEKKIKLATYASRCIENEILMHLRRTCKLKLEVSIDEPLNTDGDGNELLLSDVLGTDGAEVGEALEEEVDRVLLHTALKRLNSREQEIVNRRYGLTGKGPRHRSRWRIPWGFLKAIFPGWKKRS